MKEKQVWCWLVWVLTVDMSIRVVKAQCDARQEDYNSPNGEPYFITEEVVPNELLINMFRYLQLLRPQITLQLQKPAIQAVFLWAMELGWRK